MDRKTKLIKRNNRQDGFTLVELLVVISIIAILTTIIVGVYSSAKSRSDEKMARAEMKALELAIHNFYIDHNYYPPDTPGTPEKNGLFTSLTQDFKEGKKNYLEGAQVKNDGAGNLIAPINHPEGDPINYWLYNSSDPKNNPGRFDLWVFLRTDVDAAIESVDGKQKHKDLEGKKDITVQTTNTVRTEKLRARMYLGNWPGDYMYEKYEYD